MQKRIYRQGLVVAVLGLGLISSSVYAQETDVPESNTESSSEGEVVDPVFIEEVNYDIDESQWEVSTEIVSEGGSEFSAKWWNRKITNPFLISLATMLERASKYSPLEYLFGRNTSALSEDLASKNFSGAINEASKIALKTAGVIAGSFFVGATLGKGWLVFSAAAPKASGVVKPGAKVLAGTLPAVARYARNIVAAIAPTLTKINKVAQSSLKTIRDVGTTINKLITSGTKLIAFVEKLAKNKTIRTVAAGIVAMVTSIWGVQSAPVVNPPNAVVETTKPSVEKDAKASAKPKAVAASTAGSKATKTTQLASAPVASKGTQGNVETAMKKVDESPEVVEKKTATKAVTSTEAKTTKVAAATTATTKATTQKSQPTEKTTTAAKASVNPDTQKAISTYQSTIKNLAGALSKIPSQLGRFVSNDLPNFLTGGYYQGEGEFEETPRPVSVAAMVAWGSLGAMVAASIAALIAKRLAKKEELVEAVIE